MSMKQVYEITNRTKNSKTNRDDLVNANVMKHIPKDSATMIAHLCNNIIKSERFSSSLKKRGNTSII